MFDRSSQMIHFTMLCVSGVNGMLPYIHIYTYVYIHMYSSYFYTSRALKDAFEWIDSSSHVSCFTFAGLMCPWWVWNSLMVYATDYLVTTFICILRHSQSIYRWHYLISHRIHRLFTPLMECFALIHYLQHSFCWAGSRHLPYARSLEFDRI